MYYIYYLNFYTMFDIWICKFVLLEKFNKKTYICSLYVFISVGQYQFYLQL